MANRILEVEVRTHRLLPQEAELWVIVRTESRGPTTELRGRFVGPKSTRHSTIEVAYAIRPFPRQPAELTDLAGRVLIPEPSLWEPELPFVYDGVIELWENGVCCERRQMPGYKLQSTAITSR